MNQEILSKIATGVAIFLVGALVTHLWTRYRGRLAALSWTTSTSRLAFSANNPRYGKLEVRYNDLPVESLFWQTAEIVNESNTDLTDLTIVFGFQQASVILASDGGVASSLMALKLEEAFITSWRQLIDANAAPDQMRFYWEHRKFHVPVLNRGALARFAFLVAPPIGADPILSISCDHKGVVLKNRPPRDEVIGVDRKVATWLGVIISLLGSVGLMLAFGATWVIVLIAWFVALFGLLWGVAAIRLWRFISRLMS